MRRKKSRALLCLMMLAAALWLLPASAFAVILNNGYPYGKDMTSAQVTLVIETSNTSDTYQWQVGDTEDGQFSNIDGATENNYTFSPTSGKWYRCMVNGDNGDASKAVRVVTPGTPGADGRTWTDYQNSLYITNGTMAYMANGTYFDIVGAYTMGSTDYMIQTSFAEKWDLYTDSNAKPDPFDGKNSSDERVGNAQLKALRFSFNPSDSNTIICEAVLMDDQHAFAFGCDTQIGNDDTSSGYHDKAALQATVAADGRLRQVAMIGAKTVSGAAANAPAFVIRPISSDKFWIGRYSSRMLYAYNTGVSDGVKKTETVNGTANVATLLEGTDSGMTVSWLNVQNGTVQFQFSVGSAQNTGAVGGAIDYEAEKLQDLDANTTYTITVDGTDHSVTADNTGKIPLKTASYDFFDKTLTISKTGSNPATLTVPPRPIAVLPEDSKITATPETLVFPAAYGHEYEYSADGGASWNSITPSNSQCEITGLTPGSTIRIQAIKKATHNSFASNPATKEITLPGKIGKAPLDLQVSIGSWVEGETAQMPVVTGNLGGGKETFTYKLVTEPDTAYRETPPVRAGRYVVKAAVAETQNYLAGEATAEFDVIALPALPQTGDDSRLLLWLALCLLTGAGMLGLVRRRRNS